MSDEMKSLADTANRTLEQVRSKVEALEGKTADVVDRESLEKATADLSAKFAAEAAAKNELDALKTRLEELETKANRPGAPGRSAAEVDEHKQAFEAYVRNPDDPAAQSALREAERKASAVSTGTPGAGGYAVPQELARTIGRLAQDSSPIRGIARVVSGSVAYEELLDLNGAGHEWVGEGDTRGQTDTPNLGQVRPAYGTLAAKPEATVESLDDPFFEVEPWLSDSISREFAIAEGRAFVAGNGSNKPVGFLHGTPVATPDASRDFGVLQYRATGKAADFSDNPFDEIRRLTFDAKAAYRANGRFVLNSNTLATLAGVRDADGQYLLQRVSDEVSGVIAGYGVTVAEDMPDVEADAFPVAFGDFSQGYLISDIHGIRIIRDNVTKPGFVRWIASKRVGGTIRDSQAIKLLKIAAN